MESLLTQLFDFQRFMRDPELDALIGDAESGCAVELSDDELECLSAAGELISDDTDTDGDNP